MTDHQDTQMMNMAVVRRLLEEGFAQGQTHWLPAQVAATYVGHFTTGDHYGPEGIRIDIQGYHAMATDLSVEVSDLFAETDRVARRFIIRGTSRDLLKSGLPAGTPMLWPGIGIDRLEDGQLVESWVQIGPAVRER